MEFGKDHPHGRQGKSPVLPPPPPLQAYFGGQKFVYVRIVVAAIFDFMTEEGGESRNSSPKG